MPAPIEFMGRLTLLTRKVRGQGGERIVFKIETAATDTTWERLVAHAEGDVAVAIVPQQESLPGMGDGHVEDKPKRGKRGLAAVGED